MERRRCLKWPTATSARPTHSMRIGSVSGNTRSERSGKNGGRNERTARPGGFRSRFLVSVARARLRLQSPEEELVGRCGSPVGSGLQREVGDPPPQGERVMPHCIVCNTELPVTAMCSYHLASEEDWHKTNKVMCDGLHRNDWPKRLSSKDREEYSYE